MSFRSSFCLLPLVVLAASASAGQLVAIDSNRTLYAIDATTGAKTQLSTVGSNVGTPSALTRNSATGTLYVSSSTNDALYTLNIATGGANFLGSFGTTSIVMHGLEWDSGQNKMWGASNGNLFQVNPTTGLANQLGTSGLTSFTNLGYVASTDLLYATNVFTDRLYSVDRNTGVMTSIGLLGSMTTPVANPSGLAYDADIGVMYMIDSTLDLLYRVNVLSGAATVIGSTGPGDLQGLVIVDSAPPPLTFCFGDGTGTPCPCGNVGSNGNGCPSSLFQNGANLILTGNASISVDTVTLLGSSMPNSSALYFQGTTQQNGGSGDLFGDGLRCAGGTIIRLGTKTNMSGVSQYPAAGDPKVSVRGMCTAGASRTYQSWYRNAAAFCTASTFNLTNGVATTWVP